MSQPACQVVLTTCGDEDSARRIASSLVEEGLAACVNILPAVWSVYMWEGAATRDEELLLLVKTDASRYPALEQRLLALHPYELPEIIALPVAGGLQGYLDWVVDPDSAG